MLTAEATHLRTIVDSYGAPLAEYYYYPRKALLYIRWHGHLTAAEVVRGAEEAGLLMEEHPYYRVLNDKRDANGDWREALPWLQYEWLPQALANDLRAVAYIVSPNLEAQLVSHEFVAAVKEHIQIMLFSNEDDARRWLAEQ